MSAPRGWKRVGVKSYLSPCRRYVLDRNYIIGTGEEKWSLFDYYPPDGSLPVLVIAHANMQKCIDACVSESKRVEIAIAGLGRG